MAQASGRWRALASALMALALALVLAHPSAQTQTRPQRPPDVPFVPTTEPVVDGMLALAKVTKDDVVYDLGCGDGRIVVAAAKLGARGVGIDIDPARIAEANARAKSAGVTDKVTFILGDIFDTKHSIADATVVTLFLFPSVNERLKPRLLRELKPGTRVVSNSFAMGSDWPPEQTQQVTSFIIYLWTIPKR
jgi:SAM-dependent methyltransferase